MKDAMSALTTILTTMVCHTALNWRTGASGQGTDHYCSRDPSNSAVDIAGEVEGSIYTLYPGDSHYHNNQRCVWTIDAGLGNRVEITIVSSNLQWAHSHAICPGYDHVAIKDVYSNTSASAGERAEDSVVLQWCGAKQPDGAVSSGRYLRVEFMSDKNNPYQYTGVHLRFKTFSSSDCAPSWSSGTADSCYKLMNKETDWSSAQRHCNAEGANLASVLSENEQDFLQQTFDSSGGTAWIGLSDISYPADYQWIDRSPLTFTRFGQNHAANKFYRCVAVHFADSRWQLKDCEKDTLKPLCKSNKGSKTNIFPIPQQETDEKGSKTPVGMIAAIAVSVFVLVLVLAISFIIYRKIKGRDDHRKSAYQSEPRERQAVALHDVTVAQESRQPSAPPPDESREPVMTSAPDARMLAPPTYDEALSHPVLVTAGANRGRHALGAGLACDVLSS